ncbi:MAG: type II CRISPR-associated endonuclease Cas1 [candidate division Zixibacteria bacterium]|nr:type II CRISPR-associated endonuclease Cas1 [candidate division Zixibacteria bacterium]
MDEKIIDISEEAAGLSVRLNQLHIKLARAEASVPLEELATLIVSHPAVHYTHQALASICTHGGTVILCDEKRLPIGMLLPLVGHFTQTERFNAQASASLPLRKLLWKQVVRAKIMSQARLLLHLRGSDNGLPRMARKLRSGDPDNLEGQAARRYWHALFGPAFHRIPRTTDPINRALNYGYAVLRAAVARAICSAGLHPSLGIHHHNKYDPFCLASDLMEPFRPMVDREVISLLTVHGPEIPMDKDTKAQIINALLTTPLVVAGHHRTLFDVLARAAASLAGAYTGGRRTLLLPRW